MGSFYPRLKKKIWSDQSFRKSGAGTLAIFRLIKTLHTGTRKGTTPGLRQGSKLHPVHIHQMDGRQSTEFSHPWPTVHHLLNHITANIHFTEENRIQA